MASPCTSSSIEVGLTATEPLAPKDTPSVLGLTPTFILIVRYLLGH